jgi:hypothetical protein
VISIDANASDKTVSLVRANTAFEDKLVDNFKNNLLRSIIADGRKQITYQLRLAANTLVDKLIMKVTAGLINSGKVWLIKTL